MYTRRAVDRSDEESDDDGEVASGDKVTETDIQQAFSTYDVDGNGMITALDLMMMHTTVRVGRHTTHNLPGGTGTGCCVCFCVTLCAHGLHDCALFVTACDQWAAVLKCRPPEGCGGS
jgi:hypothetical protein